MSRVWRHFKIEEFECPCCHENKISENFVTLLNQARSICPIVFKINSGWRCEKHNKDVGGSPTSSHLIGEAADIWCSGDTSRLYMVKSLIDVGFRRIGIGRMFIHVDMDDRKDDAIWLY